MEADKKIENHAAINYFQENEEGESSEREVEALSSTKRFKNSTGSNSSLRPSADSIHGGRGKI